MHKQVKQSHLFGNLHTSNSTHWAYWQKKHLISNKCSPYTVAHNFWTIFVAHLCYASVAPPAPWQSRHLRSPCMNSWPRCTSSPGPTVHTSARGTLCRARTETPHAGSLVWRGHTLRECLEIKWDDKEMLCLLKRYPILVRPAPLCLWLAYVYCSLSLKLWWLCGQGTPC